MNWDMIEEMRVYGSSCNNIHIHTACCTISQVYMGIHAVSEYYNTLLFSRERPTFGM